MTYQRNRLITLLDNYTISQKNYETALNSAGTAQKKYDIYLESSQAKIDRFKAQLEDLSQNTINSKLIKSFIDLGTVIVQVGQKVGSLLFSVGSDKINNTVKSLSDNVASLQSEYDKFSGVEDKTPAQQAYLSLLKQELAVKQQILANEKMSLTNKEVYGVGDSILKSSLSSQIKDNIKYYKAAEDSFKSYQVSLSKDSGNIDLMNHFDKSKEAILQYSDALLQNKKQLETYKDASGQIPEGVKSLIASIDGTIKSLNDLGIVVVETTKKQEVQTKTTRDATFSQADFDKSLKTTSDTIDSYQSDMSNLSSVYEIVNESEKVSASNLLDLIQKYPEMASQILQINNSKEDGIRITQLLADIEKQEAVAKLSQTRAKLVAELELQNAYKNSFDYLSTHTINAPDENTAKLEAVDKAVELLKSSTITDFIKSSGNKSSGEQYNEQYSKSYLSNVEKADSVVQHLSNEYKKMEDSGANIVDLNKKLDELAQAQIDKQKALNIARGEMASKQSEIYNQLLSYGVNASASEDEISAAVSLVPKGETRKQVIDWLKDYQDLVKSISQTENDYYSSAATEASYYAEQQDRIKKNEEEIAKANAESAKAREDLYNEIVDALKDLNDAEKDSTQTKLDELEDTIDKQKTLYEEDFDNYKDSVEKKYDAEADVLNRTKELLSRESKESDYNEAQTTRQKDLSDLQLKYNKIAADNSGMYEKDKLELQEKISDKLKEINDAEKDYILENQQNQIDDIIDLKQTEKDNAIETAEDIKDANIDALQDAQDAFGNTVADYKDKLLELEEATKTFGAQAETILAGGQNAVLTFFTDYADKLKLSETATTSLITKITDLAKTANTQVASVISSVASQIDVLNKLLAAKLAYETATTQSQRDAASATANSIRSSNSWLSNISGTGSGASASDLQNAINGMSGGNNGNSGGGGSSSSGDSSSSGEEVAGSATAHTPGGIDVSVDVGSDGHVIDTGLPEGTVVETSDGHGYEITGTDSNGDYTSTQVYDTGGILSSGNRAVNLSGADERILDPTMTKIFDSFVNLLPTTTSVLDNIINSLPSISSNSSSSSNNNLQLNVSLSGANIASTADAKSIGNQVGESIVNKLKWSGYNLNKVAVR